MAGRSDWIRGMERKLCLGGGHEVAHSRDAPNPQGSSTFTAGALRWVRQTFHKNANVEAPRMKAPIDETIWNTAKLFG
jgi:hypothetical protein